MNWHDQTNLNRFLSGLDIRALAFATCDVREGWRLDFPAAHAAGVHLVLSGSGRVLAGGDTVSVADGSFVLIPAGQTYAFEHAAGGSRYRHGGFEPPPDGDILPAIQAGDGKPGMLLACGLASALIGGTLDVFGMIASLLVRRLDGADLIGAQFIRLGAELHPPRAGTRAMIEALLKQCLVLLLRDPDGIPGLPWSAEAAHPPLWRAFAAMADSLAADHTVDRLATIAGMSRTAFAAQFAAAFGRPPMALLRELRLRRAAALLASSSVTIEQAAGAVGYSSRSQFSRAFRELHGCDPSSFRASKQAFR